jgi:hypothetical protein
VTAILPFGCAVGDQIDASAVRTVQTEKVNVREAPANGRAVHQTSLDYFLKLPQANLASI